MTTTTTRRADCHPEKPHYALGKCRWCYTQELRVRNPEFGARDVASQRRAGRQWRLNNVDKERATALGRNYAITAEAVDAMLVAQNGLCAVCSSDISGRTSKRACARVDHDHETGRIRGLLCHNCNLGIGYLGDTAAGLERAIAYLRRST